tara:strand:- start:335 stop:679 length:345 start_codon:yes stop_codon:yes gene_type:complete
MAKRKDLTIKKRKHFKNHGIFSKGFDGKGDGALDGKAHFGDPRLGARQRAVEMRRRKELKHIHEHGYVLEEKHVKAQMKKDEEEQKAKEKALAEALKKRKALQIKKKKKKKKKK